VTCVVVDDDALEYIFQSTIALFMYNRIHAIRSMVALVMLIIICGGNN